MKTVASIVSVTMSCALGACGAVNDSSATAGAGDAKDDAVCVETVPPLDNTAVLAPDAAQEGGS